MNAIQIAEQFFEEVVLVGYLAEGCAVNGLSTVDSSFAYLDLANEHNFPIRKHGKYFFRCLERYRKIISL